MNPDPYRILGVSPGAGPEEIKTAFRRLALRYHPDLHRGQELYEAQFRRIAEAYRLLSKTGFSPAAGRSAEKILVRWAGKSGHFLASMKNRLASGKRVLFTLPVTLQEGLSGSEKVVRLTRSEPCPDHHGPDCHRCGGGKIISHQTRFLLPVPAGIRNKDRLRFSWEGIKGTAEISLLHHPFLRLVGDDLEADIPVPLFLALTGGKVTVPSLEGPEEISFEPMTHPHSTIRRAGKGYARRDKGRGSAVYNLWVELPSSQKKSPPALDDSLLYPTWQFYLKTMAKELGTHASIPGKNH